MNKRNGNRTRQKQKPTFEQRAVSDPTDIQRNGISILAAGPDTGEKPDEIQMIWHVPQRTLRTTSHVQRTYPARRVD